MNNSQVGQKKIDKLKEQIANTKAYIDTLLNSDTDDTEIVESIGDTSFERAMATLDKLEKKLSKLITSEQIKQ